MENTANSVQTVVQLRWKKDYEAAVSYFKEAVVPLMTASQIAMHPELVMAVSDSLKELNKQTEALLFVIRWLKLDPENIRNHKLLINLAWLGHAFLKTNQGLSQQIIDWIFKLLKQLNNYEHEKQLFGMLYFGLIKALKKYEQQPWPNISMLLEQFDDQCFNEEVNQINFNKDGKVRSAELASDLEKYTMHKIKHLYALGQYEACIALSKEALGRHKKFHHGNQAWITRYMALAYQQNAQFDAALHFLNQALYERKEWFIMYEMALIYYKTKASDNAIEMAIKAFAEGGYSPYKTALFAVLSDWMTAKGDHMLAKKFAQLACLCRRESGWNVPQALLQKAGECIDTKETDANQIYKRLLADLAPLLPDDKKKIWYGSGMITRILHEGENGDGFITDENQQSIYFRMAQSKLALEEVRCGKYVGFKAITEKRKGKNTHRALKIFAQTK
ncbi:MAG: tetratricopeptide repeat protein [Bacteroidales bacterium]|jgi:tetratricopeptide (TPR) repeat protein|nr:tetratricopeptide repeat protein [Bacteroidales bacterium]